MKKTQMKNYTKMLFIGLVGLIITSCNGGQKPADTSVNNPPKVLENKIVCPKNLSYSECPNPPALHGQIMIHNMTDKSYDVNVEHHGNLYETKRIAPGDGWTFIGVIQGKRLLSAKPTLGGITFESNCTVIGNTMHMMNIMPDGFKMVESGEHSENSHGDMKDKEVIKIPIRNKTGH